LQQRSGIIGGNAVSEPADVNIWDLENRKIVLTLRRAGERAVFSPDGKWIATLADPRLGEERIGGTVRFWNAATGELIFTFRQRGERAVTLAFGPDGRLVLAGTLVTVWDVTGSGLQPVFRFDQEAECVAVSPDS